MAKSKRVHVVGIDQDGYMYHDVYADKATYKAAKDGCALYSDYNGVIRLWDEERDGELPVDEDGSVDVDTCEEQDIPVEFGDVLDYKHFVIYIKGDNVKVVDNT